MSFGHTHDCSAHGHSHGPPHGHSHGGPPGAFSFEFLRNMMMAHQLDSDDDDDDDAPYGYYDSDDEYDDDDDEDDDDEDDDIGFHGHSHGGVPCHGHSHGGPAPRKIASEHYLSMNEVLQDLKQATKSLDELKGGHAEASTTTAAKGKKTKKQGPVEQIVKQDYTDALFQIGENMESMMNRFTDELPSFIEKGGLDLIVSQLEKEGLNPNEPVMTTSNHLGNASFAALSNMIEMTDADDPNEDPEDAEDFHHNFIIDQLENSERDTLIRRLWYFFSSQIEKLPYLNTPGARRLLQEVLELQMKTVCGIEHWRKNIRQWWGGLEEVENFVNCGKQIMKDLSDVKSGIGLSKDKEKNLKFKEYAYFCSESWLRTSEALIRTTTRNSNILLYLLSVPQYEYFLKSKRCTCDHCSFVLKQYKYEDWDSGIAFDFLQNGGFETMLHALELSIEDSIGESTEKASINLFLMLMSEQRSSESLHGSPVPKGTVTKLLKFVRHLWTAHIAVVVEGSHLQETFYMEAAIIFDVVQALCTLKPEHSAELLTEEAISEWMCLLRCVVERIKLNIIPKSTSPHCQEHSKEWRVLVPLLAVLVRDNYSFGEYLWDEELGIVEILLTKLTPNMIQTSPLWACSVFRTLYYGMQDESYAENVASRVKKSSSVGLVAEVKRSAGKCANLNFWAQKLYGAVQTISPTNRKPQKIKQAVQPATPYKPLPCYFSDEHPVITSRDKSVGEKRHMEELRELQLKKQEFYKRQRQRKQEQAKVEEQRKIEKRQIKNKIRREQEAKNEEQHIKFLLQKQAEIEREKHARQAQAQLEEQLLSHIIALQKKNPDIRAKRISQELNAKGLNVTESKVNAIMEKYELSTPVVAAQPKPKAAGIKKKKNKNKNKKK